MPIDILTQADLTRITGPVQINTDPAGSVVGSLNVAGAIVGSGALTVAGNIVGSGNLTVASNVTASGNLTVTSNLTVSNLASLAEIGGGVLNGGSGGSAVSLAAGGTVTIGSGVRIVRISVAAIAGAINMPTDSVDGRELTVLNAGTATLTLVTNVAAALAIASGIAARVTWDVASTLWFHSA